MLTDHLHLLSVYSFGMVLWLVRPAKPKQGHLRLGTGMLRMNFYIQGKMKNPPVTLIRIELHSLVLGVSISSLVALVSVEWHSLGLGS